MQLPEQIDSERIVLKHPIKPTFKLAEELYAIIDKSRKTLEEWLPWVDKTNSPEDEFVGYFVGTYRKYWQEGSGADYLIYQKDTNQILGIVALCHVEEKNRSAEIGYWLANRWRLPLPIQNAIRYQADPLACPSETDRPLAAAVKIARILVRVCGEASLTDFDPVVPPADDLWELIKLPNHDNFEAPLQKRLQTAAAICAELV